MFAFRILAKILPRNQDTPFTFNTPCKGDPVQALWTVSPKFIHGSPNRQGMVFEEGVVK